MLKIPMLPYISTESPRNSSLSSIVRVKVDPPCEMIKVLTAYTKTCDLLSLQVGIFLLHRQGLVAVLHGQPQGSG